MGEKDLDKLNLDDSESEGAKPAKKDKKSKKKAAVSDESDEEGTIKPQKGGFALLMDDGGDSLPSEESEPEVESAPKKSKDKKSKSKKESDVKDEINDKP